MTDYQALLQRLSTFDEKWMCLSDDRGLAGTVMREAHDAIASLTAQLMAVRSICERESERFPRVMGDFAREVLTVLSRDSGSEAGNHRNDKPHAERPAQRAPDASE